ncbi:hypothetical protein Tco_1419149 [Tanacetum coccineum]
MEIAYDLCNWGAQTSIVVRSPVHVLSKELVQLGVYLLRYVSCTSVDKSVLTLSRLLYGDLCKYGVQRPTKGPFYLKRETRRSPVIDVGTIQGFKQYIRFNDGQEKQFNAIIFPTGFRSTVLKGHNVTEVVKLVEEYIGEFLVVATGENSEGFIPSVYGLNNLKVSCCMESFVNTKQKGQTKDYLISNERSSAIDVGTASWIQTGDTQVMTTSKDIEGDVINFDDGQERQLDELMPLLLAIQKSNSIQKIKSEALR